MPTCNLWETIYSIWLQQSRKRGSYLYTTTSNDYVWSFRNNSLYKEYLRGGPSKKGLDKNELCLHKANAFGDPLQMAIVVTKYVSGSSFISKMLHFEVRIFLILQMMHKSSF
jgi:hypothetical protein